MKTQATDWLKKVLKDFQAFQPGQKVVTVLAVLALVGGGVLFATWKASPQYAPLYSNLSTQDAAAIVEKLGENGTPYQLAAGGSQILVPADSVYDVRLQMSSDGLPGSSAGGYSLLDQEGITTSDFKQQVDFQRAIEGELAKTIGAMEGVQSATVHLAIPKQDVFNDGSKVPTAAVMLTMKPTASISKSQVQSIVYLVSSAVPDLTPENTTVASSDGTVLSAPGDDLSGLGSADGRSEMTQEYNSRVAGALQTMLDTALGGGHAVVTVNAELDFDSTSTVTQDYTYTPDTPPLTVTEQTESYTNSSPGNADTLGNNEQGDATATSGESGSYDKTERSVNNALGTVTKTVENTPGAVKQLAVAVLLDKNAPNLDPVAIQALVTSAVGLNTQRGDTLAIQSMAFDTSATDAAAAERQAAEEAAAAEAAAAKLNSWIKQGTIAGVILAIFLVTFLAARRRAKRSAEPDSNDLTLITHDLPPDVLLPPPTPAAAPEPIVIGDASAGRRALVALADEQPDEVARVLSSWLGTSDSVREGAKR